VSVLKYHTMEDMCGSEGDSQENPRLVWYSKVHYPLHNSLPLVLILNKLNDKDTF
jgi:hypothetical protein